MDDKKIAYLQMIQSTIDRMSTTSAIFKGFCATVVIGILTTAFIDLNKWILLLAALSVLSFLFIDIYYLKLERRFRALYNRVRLGEHDVDFDLTPPQIKSLCCNDKCCIWHCIKSPSIYLFYGPSFCILSIIIVMKFKTNY